MTHQIIGSKGGSGGGSFVTKPDTLRSNDSFEILLGLGSGRWKGLVNGLKGLKINGVPMENEDGTSNFQDIYALFADGNPLEDQLVTFKLGGGGATTGINTQLSNPNTGSPGPWISGATSTFGADFVDLRFVVQQLFYQDAKSIRENTANIEIQMRPSGTSTWINPFTAPTSNTLVYNPNGYPYSEPSFAGANFNLYLGRALFRPSGTGFIATPTSGTAYLPITGKTSSAFVKELRIAVPNAGAYANKTWEVRARLIEKDTVDADPVQERRIISFESIASGITDVLGDHPDWDGLVWMQIHGKASEQFSGFPEIEGIFDTKICKVPPPSVFNPTTRAYTAATWDGSYQEHYTNDPAWQIKEFIEDPIHGLAALQPGSTMDKWDALDASKYYSALVPDGKGGTHPRFSMNLTINEARDVDEMMGYLAGAVNSYIEDVGDGVWRLKVDKPETPIMLFTEDNIFGEFGYSHSDVDTRFNDWRGTFIDEDLDYEVNTARVFDQDDIDENGIKFTEIALVGCTNHQEALRRLMFRMRVSLNEYKVVNFQTNRVGRYIPPLSTILIADGGLNTDHLKKSTGRVQSYAGTTVTLKRPIRLEVGVAYNIHFTTATKQIVTKTVTNAAGARGDVTSISINSALPSNVLVDSVVTLDAVGLPANPLLYRVIGVERSEEDEDKYTIMASIIDSGKWAAMDGVSAEALAAQESEIAIDPPTAPAGGMFDTIEYATEFASKRVLEVNWNRPAGMYLEGYRVQYKLNNGPLKLLAANLTDSIIELEDPEDGLYEFQITSLDRRGVVSQPLIGTYTLDGSQIFRPSAHIRGTLVARPVEAPYNGFRYTVTTGTVPVTYVWENGAWVSEANLITEGSQIGVENGATVGMTYAEEVAFADLVATYGTTVSAAASAAAAAIDEALAEAHKNAASVSATSASGSATTATGQATIATNQATAAATSATLSATYLTNARSVVTAVFPHDFVNDGTFFTPTFQLDPATVDLNLSRWSFPTVSGIGKVAQLIASASTQWDIAPRGRILAVAGRRYTYKSRFRCTVNATSGAPSATLYGIYNNSTFAYVGGPLVTFANLDTGDGWQILEISVTGDAIIAAGGVYTHALLRFDTPNSTGTFQIQYIKMEDTTESNASANSATVSSTQAAAATAAASTATTQATLSATAATTATKQVSTTLPFDFSQDGLYFTGDTGLWASAPFANASIVANSKYSFSNVANEGRSLNVISNTGGLLDTAPQGAMKRQAGRTYRVSARAKVTAGSASGNIYALALDSSYSFLGALDTTWSKTSSDPYFDVVREFTATDLAGAAVYYRPMFRINNSPGATVSVISIRIEDITESSNAAFQASVATTQAATATSAAASATSSMVLSASLGYNALNVNSSFADWPGGSGTIPPGWLSWIDSGSNTRVAGDLGGYAYQSSNASGANQGMLCAPSGMFGKKDGGYFVIEADVTLVSGVLNGAGFYLDKAGFSDTGTFSTMINPSTGSTYGAGTVGYRYKFSKLVSVLYNGSGAFNLYLMTGWGGHDPTQPAKTLKWHRLLIRDATPQEIRDQTVLTPLQATVSTHATAIATHDTKLASYVTRVSAGSGTAELALVALDSGGVAASSITLKADKIKLGSITAPVLEISGGEATFNGQLNVGPTSGDRMILQKNVQKIIVGGVTVVQIGDLSL